ncbi:MAG: Spy/CpxP family protein refolding chaperone [Acidobacteriia bacterium]|nr:Spy/CpxP family protein refolding chaperone [Terriglobia bacterium]
MTLQVRGLLAVVLGVTSAVAQQVPRALEQSSTLNSIIAKDGTNSFRFFAGANPGRWWTRPEEIERLGLSAEQRKNLNDILQQHRLKLIDLDAALQKEEVTLEPLVNADQPDDAKVFAQVDRVAQARAELEKANSRMLWQVRRVLTPDQWKLLQSPRPTIRLQPPTVK